MSLCDISSDNILPRRTRSGRLYGSYIAYRIEDVVVSRNEQGTRRVTPQGWVKEVESIPRLDYGSRKKNMLVIHKICTGEVNVEDL